MTQRQVSAPKCFLGCSSQSRIVLTLTREELLTVWRLTGVAFSYEALGKLITVAQVHLYACSGCGFEFFDPRLAGGDQFYSELHTKLPGYYAPARPENERNARFAQEHEFRTILDIGCGTGLALDVARQRGLETFGVEFNRGAAEEARSRGHTVFTIPIQELDSRWEGHFDLISLNQLLEHVPDPISLIKNCIRLLSPRGVIAIAVPGAEGVLRGHPWMALNWPPHHVSRWRRKDLRMLSERCGLIVVRSGGDQLLGSELEGILLANRVHCLALRKTYWGPSPVIIRLLSFLYRKTGMKHVFRSQGHSIFCFLRRKSQASNAREIAAAAI
jgi:SAM-dependent methyltransferase